MRVMTMPEAGANGYMPLTKTQLAVLAERAAGWSTSDVAVRLEIPRSQVEELLDEARGILGATHTPHAVAEAFRAGYLA